MEKVIYLSYATKERQQRMNFVIQSLRTLGVSPIYDVFKADLELKLGITPMKAEEYLETLRRAGLIKISEGKINLVGVV